MKYQEITQKIIGASMEVHKILGNGFQELIYQRALELEMKLMGLSFQREYEMDIFYKGERVGGRRVDFFVENCIIKSIDKFRRCPFGASNELFRSLQC